MRTASIFFILISLFAGFQLHAQRIQYLFGQKKHVNPFIGTQGTGHTFPGASRPFGMVQVSPDTHNWGWNHTAGYQYNDTSILGFSNTHISGAGIPEFGDVLLLPLTKNTLNSIQIGIDKQAEKAHPGYYKVQLNNGVGAELTSSAQVAFHQYKFEDAASFIRLDFSHGLHFLDSNLIQSSTIEWVDSNAIKGRIETKNWVERQYFFYIEFDADFTKETKDSLVYLLSFDTKKVSCKIGLSTQSTALAQLHIQEEIPHWDFKRVVKESAKEWEEYLGRFRIQANATQKEIFYSALYHLLLQPVQIDDPNIPYSTLSIWDSYRAAHPFYTLFYPERVDGFINAMLNHATQFGFLPIWTAWGQDNYCMISNHAVPIITDAVQKGFQGFDKQKALQLIDQTLRTSHIHSDWELYERFGYYPFDLVQNEAVSRTLEHCVDDAAAAHLAQLLQNDTVFQKYKHRSLYYQHLFDSSTQLFRGKDQYGQWRTPFDPFMATSPLNNPGDYTEANAWQYFWTPAQTNAEEFIKFIGGQKQLETQLDQFFSTTAKSNNAFLGQEGLIGLYAHGNEPNHHIAYLYSFTTHPEKGQKIIDSICTNFYSDKPNGIIGNEDCGQMSAWYLFACLGFYPVNPFDGTYVLGSPQFNKIRYSNGETKLTFINNQVTHSQQKGIQILIDGQLQNSLRIEHATLLKGRKIEIR